MNLKELKKYYYDNTRNYSDNGRHDNEHELKDSINFMFDNIKIINDDITDNKLIEKIEHCILIVKRNNMYNYLMYLNEKIDLSITLLEKISKSDIIKYEYLLRKKEEIKEKIDKSYKCVIDSYDINSYEQLKKLDTTEYDNISDSLQRLLGDLYWNSKKI